MTLNNGPIIRSGFPRAGSPVGDQKRDEFIADMLAILGDTRLLWLPKATDTTAATEDSRHAATITWDATVASRLATLGSGLSQDFDGTDDEGDISDDDRYSFGDGAVDSAFSIVLLFNLDNLTNTHTLFAKYDDGAGGVGEWYVEVVATSGKPRLVIRDDSASANLGREDGTALSTSAWNLLVGTYDGSGGITGINLNLNGALVDDADVKTGTYVAMENGAEPVRLGVLQAGGNNANFLDGKMALAAICAKELTLEEVWAVKALCNAHFDLSL